MHLKTYIIAVLSVLGAGSVFGLENQKTGQFLLPTNWSNAEYNLFSSAARPVAGAPVAADVTISGVSQSPDNQMGVWSYGPALQFRRISRFDSTTEAGAVQFNINLSNYDSYLAANELRASAIDLKFNSTGKAGTTYSYDVYLSYTDPQKGISIVSINGKTPAEIYSDIFAVGHAANVGSIAGGEIEVIAKNTDVNAYQFSYDLAGLYNNGVREFNLIIVSNAYGSNRELTIEDTSGIFLTTTAIPEANTASLLGGTVLIITAITALRKMRQKRNPSA